MSAAPRTAVVLAAGMGSRLQDIWPDLPKGFIVIGDETLIERSIRLLQLRAVARIVIVAGHLGDAYRELAKRLPGVEVVHNPDFASTGSMASLARALDEVDEDFLLLESDLFYEERALDALLRNDARDVLLVSGPTGATDEVWVEAPDGRLTGLSKQADDLSQVSGELVGIVKVSRALGRPGRADIPCRFDSNSNKIVGSLTRKMGHIRARVRISNGVGGSNYTTGTLQPRDWRCTGARKADPGCPVGREYE